MALKTKTLSEKKCICLCGHQIPIMRNKLVRIMLLTATVSVFNCGNSIVLAKSLEKRKNDHTGICYRRLSAVGGNGKSVDRYEVVIVKRSSSLYNDIERVKAISSNGSPIRNPDIMTSDWIPAFVNEEGFTNNVKFSCNNLPSIR